VFAQQSGFSYAYTGFTLIEMLAVILILSLIATVLVVRVSHPHDRSREEMHVLLQRWEWKIRDQSRSAGGMIVDRRLDAEIQQSRTYEEIEGVHWENPNGEILTKIAFDRRGFSENRFVVSDIVDRPGRWFVDGLTGQLTEPQP
jgi:prepilin-type N-terminal cleavage/methylation domain-containing protein